ncbi:MAG TPA: hypothetical protein DDZ81_04100 [Acetobacteraceae bacterium]|jgi:peptidyl-prolyl cis-trans isomerase C|nr:hypothetical protein [Acetobacteraceae bacterium]
MDRRTFRSLLAQSLVISALMSTGTTAAVAQAPKADPSPFAPGDLKAPIFDTQTPIYSSQDAQAKSANTVVADVDGRAITLGDVQDAINELPPAVKNLPFDDLFPGVVAQLVRQQALAIRAQRQALDEDPAVRRKIKAVSDRMLGDELIRREASSPITEAALLNRYNKDVAGKPGPEEVHVRVIMVTTEDEALGIIRELRAGADFATLAKRSSKDPTASAGGDAGFVTLNQLTPEVGGAVFALEPPHFTAYPVHSAGAWFVLKAEERRREAAQPFSAVREALYEAMTREGASDVITAALAGVTARLFDLNGKEAKTVADGKETASPR